MGKYHDRKPVICIVGPTGSGKSALAQAVAIALDGEVVSADSMQVYKGMDIGTGKVPPSERVVAHYGLDLVEPGQPYSAALFQQYARDCFDRIAAMGKQPILCGGTGFYIRAAIDDYEFPKGDQVGNDLRDELNAYVAEHGPAALWERLLGVDEASARIIPPNDVKRVVRAFELLEDGVSYAEQKEKLASIPQAVPAVLIGLSVEPAILRRRIDERVDDMAASGLVNEVKSLLERGFREGITAPQAIGYKEVVAALDGELTMEEALEQVKIATHRYAKRQRTWFRKDKRIHWIDADELNLDVMLNEVLDIVATISPSDTTEEIADGKAGRVR